MPFNVRMGGARSAVCLVLTLAGGTPVLAHQYRSHHASSATADYSHISCETVRAYVSEVGLVQARAMARAAGMTAAQEWRARQCLSKQQGV